MADDLLSSKDQTYDASSIEVLEPLEAVRLRPGMYIGGIDERAYHHLAAEILDNSMDEAVAGHASRIEVELNADGSLTIRDNGRATIAKILRELFPRGLDHSAVTAWSGCAGSDCARFFWRMLNTARETFNRPSANSPFTPAS